MKSIKFFILILLLVFFSLFPAFVLAGGSCFLPGTLITLENNSQVPIENVKAGDKIISFDDKLSKVVVEVLETEAPIRDDYYILYMENGKKLKLTDEHPLYIKSGTYEGWGSIIPEATMDDAKIRTKKIEIGNYILNVDKQWIKIIGLKHVNEKVQTYNLKKVDKTNTFFAEGFLAHNKGGDKNTPPPPPPCPIKSAGCYKLTNTKVGFGELLPKDFDFYLAESKCIPGGCYCTAPADIKEQKDPDESSGACNCIAGTSWNANAKCCGDDTDDCGKVASGVLCSIDANFVSSNWFASSTSVGDIRYVGCGKSEYLSDGNDWQKCDGAFWKRSVGNSEYICIGRGKESIVECCGDGSCKSRVDGKRLATGQSVNPSKYVDESGQSNQTSDITGSNKTYYCTPSRKFATDLDSNQIGVTANDRKATCEKAGFKWTGTKCCSEDDDSNEFYNDPNGIGGCWDKKPIVSIGFVDGTNNSVANFRGEFHGCAVDKRNFNKDNDDLLGIPDQHTFAQLITNHDFCFNDPDQNYYCSYKEQWLPTNGAERTHFSIAPVDAPQLPAECCAQGECWDGAQCVANQRANPLAQPIGNGSRCIDGQWTNSAIKSSFDAGSSGYCPNRTQCLINVFGKAETSQCIDADKYIDDNYCENGNWTSRTKFLALKLLRLKSGDYTLFCDSRENALNNLQYLTESNELVANVLTNLQINNFCILKTGSKIIAATSINKNLEEIPSSSLNLLGIKNCDAALIDDGQYYSCDSTNKVWFNKKLKSFIYSKDAINIPSDQESTNFLGNIINNIVDFIKNLVTQQPFDQSIFVKGLKKFDRLYLTQQGSKSISGSIEGKSTKNAVIQYAGFNTNICKFIEQFNQAKRQINQGDTSSISCQKDNSNNYYVLAQGSQFTNINPESIWTDLTSKLRLK